MRTCTIALLLVGLGCFQSATAVEPARVARLIQQLGSDCFDERETAGKALDEFGPAALEALRAATASKDAEIARRSRELVEGIERRIDTARALEAPRLRLVCKDTPLPEAIADFAKKSGCPVQLDDKEKERLAKRTITLDTGEVTFWQAFEQLCDRAGLIEKRPEIKAAAPDPYAGYLKGPTSYVNPYQTDGRTGAVMLVEGKRPAVPTQLAGSLRIQALPASTPARNSEHVQFTLEAAAAPGLEWQSLVSLRIHKAINEKGQLLEQPAAVLGRALDFASPYEAVFIELDENGRMPGLPVGHRERIQVQLKPANQPSGLLREVHGTLAAGVRTPPTALLTVDNILKAAGQTVKGSDGGSLTLNEVRQDEKGLFHLKVRLEVPPETESPWSPPVARMGFNGRLRARALVVANRDGRVTTMPRDLSLVDARGKALALEEVQPVSKPWSNDEFKLVFRREAEQGEPARLIYTGRRSVLVEVPFVLKDVPLP